MEQNQSTNSLSVNLAFTYKVAPFILSVPVFLFSVAVFLNFSLGKIADYEKWYVLFGMIVIDLVIGFISIRYAILPQKITASESKLVVKKLIGQKTYDLNKINKIYGSFYGLLMGNWDSGYPAWIDIYFKDGSNLRFALGSFGNKEERQAILKFLLPYIKKPELYMKKRAGDLIAAWESEDIFSL